VSQKSTPTEFLSKLGQIFTDFQTSFTDTLSRKFDINRSRSTTPQKRRYTTLYQFAVVFIIISSWFSCKFEKNNEKPLKWFSLKKHQALIIKNLYLIFKGYGLRKILRVTWERMRKMQIGQAFDEVA